MSGRAVWKESFLYAKQNRLKALGWKISLMDMMTIATKEWMVGLTLGLALLNEEFRKSWRTNKASRIWTATTDRGQQTNIARDILQALTVIVPQGLEITATKNPEPGREF